MPKLYAADTLRLDVFRRTMMVADLEKMTKEHICHMWDKARGLIGGLYSLEDL